MNTSFDLVGYDVSGSIEERNGLAYLPWPAAYEIAGFQNIRTVTFNGKPAIEMLGGAVVAVDVVRNEGMTDHIQRVWLPVLDEENNPVGIDSLSPRDVTDSIARCRVKAIAMTRGLGLCLYAGTSARQFVDNLGITPDSDLAKVSAVVSTNGHGVSYVEWAYALAAANITDPHFSWRVILHDDLPVIKIGRGWVVGVGVTYKGRSHVEYLPIMDRDHESIENPTVFDWNTTVMRCLTKAIAVVSGYGLAVYAGKIEPQKMPVAPAANVSNRAADLAIAIEEALANAGKPKEALLKWLGLKGDENLVDLPIDILERAWRVFERKRA